MIFFLFFFLFLFFFNLKGFELGFWYLTPTIFQLYHGSKFYWCETGLSEPPTCRKSLMLCYTSNKISLINICVFFYYSDMRPMPLTPRIGPNTISPRKYIIAIYSLLDVALLTFCSFFTNNLFTYYYFIYNFFTHII